MLDSSKIIIGTKVCVIGMDYSKDNYRPYHTIKDMDGKYFILDNDDEYRNHELELYTKTER